MHPDSTKTRLIQDKPEGTTFYVMHVDALSFFSAGGLSVFVVSDPAWTQEHPFRDLVFSSSEKLGLTPPTKVFKRGDEFIRQINAADSVGLCILDPPRRCDRAPNDSEFEVEVEVAPLEAGTFAGSDASMEQG
jgi:hypothetical protein